jgi:hypothetical protein
MFAHNDCVTGNDAALKQTEQRRHHVERDQAVIEKIEQQCRCLQNGAKQESAQSADLVGNEAGANAARNTEPHHQRQHLGPAGEAVPEIAAISHDVNLGHRHRDAAANGGDRE